MWKTLRKTYLFGLALLGFLFVSFLNSANVNAEAVTTTSLGLLYGDSGGNWQLQRGIYYGFGNGITFNTDMYGRIQEYDWLTPVITLQGSTASIHFETNIVASFFGNLPNNSVYNPWTNLEYLTVKSCGSRSINTQSVSTAVTEWRDTYDGRPRYNYTLTVYGDVSVNGFSPNTTDDVRCTVSAGDTFFFNVINTGTGISNNLRVWFEQNPMSFYWSNSIDNSLLQTQINQNNTIINQNEQIINSQNETNDWLKDTTPPNVDSSGLAQSAGWLPAGPVDSILTIPITLLTGIVNVFTNPSACQAVQLPLPFVNTNIDLPCVGPILDQIGITPLWNIVGAIIGFFLIWSTYKWLYEFVDKTLTFRENNSSIWGGL